MGIAVLSNSMDGGQVDQSRHVDYLDGERHDTVCFCLDELFLRRGPLQRC